MNASPLEIPVQNITAVLSLEELANSFCLMMANAYRLIEDGEKLAATGRSLGAIGCFQNALEELIRGHLISKAVLLDDADTAAWREFWVMLNDRTKLLFVLENEIHSEIFSGDESRARYRVGFSLLTLDFIRNSFDGNAGKFLPPGGDLNGLPSMKEAATRYYEYVIGVFHALNFYGLPNPATQAQTFWGLRTGARNAPLIR